MAMLLKGADAARALTEQLHEQAEELKKNGTEPCLAILRVGAREDDLSYERGALKRCEKVGITVRQVVLPEDAGQQELLDNIRSLNEDERVHGVLMFRPLPKHLDDEAARRALEYKLRMLSKERDLRKKREKAFRFLVSRGFSGAVIRELFSKTDFGNAAETEFDPFGDAECDCFDDGDDGTGSC